MKNYLDILNIDEHSITPKYLQLVNAFIAGIENEQLSKDDMLPSINELSIGLDISRNTIERVYSELKAMGIVGSVPGKGFFIMATNFKKPLKILLLFNKLSSHKKIIYDAFVETLGENAAIDFYIYNNDIYLFKKIVTEKLKLDYTKFIIIPHFKENEDSAYEIINSIPKEKLILMDKLVSKIDGEFAAVYENFESDIYGALSTLRHKLSKYDTLKIIFPKNTYHSKGILKGFQHFCSDYAFNYHVVHNLKEEPIQEKTVYINLMEDDLVLLIQKILNTDLVIGKDVGVISYNETAIKKIILSGITTISTDFRMMGIKTAEMAQSNLHEHYAVPFTVNERNSI
ncbi:GntR family transcriptional regulator [Pedobacter sp.]|uniref:GntR family transcriptional regulator n=1 Tax=Pedobacter sp. TaxID=1411316 RepID=UPI003D7FA817